jgi:peptide/nickel transport system substrate-binding protein
MKKFLLVLLVSSLIIIPTAFFASAKSPDKIIIAIMSEPDSLDLSSSVTTPLSHPIASNISEMLVDIAPNGKIGPGLASWKVSRDGKVVDFELRRGVKFHSGDPLTTKDVEFSWKRGREKVPGVQVYGRLVERLEILDDYHFRFHLKKPDVLFFATRIAGVAIVSKSYYDRVGEDQFVRHPVGTGPYKFVRWEPGQYIEMEAYENYWGRAPSVRKVRFVIVREDTTRVAMLKSGEADLIMETPYPMVKELEEAGFKTARLYTHPSVSLRFQTINPDVPWHDRRVRQAMAYAIDTKAIVNSLLHGIPGHYPRLAPDELGYDADMKQYPYDPEKAKKLLAEAGYPKGFEMPLYYPIGRVAGVKETTEAVALYLNAVGIKCKVEGLEFVKWMRILMKTWHNNPKEKVVVVDTFPMANTMEPIWVLDVSFKSSSEFSLYSNPEIDKIAEEGRSTLDDEKRAELVKKGMRLLHEDVASVHLWGKATVYSMKKNINYTPTRKTDFPLMLVKDITVKD